MDIRKLVAVLAIAGTYLVAAAGCGDYTGGGPPPARDGGMTDGGVPPAPNPPPYVNSPGSNGR